jgi:hypothetical protein
VQLTDQQILYVRAMGKAVRVTAVFNSDDDANAYLTAHPDPGCRRLLPPAHPHRQRP